MLSRRKLLGALLALCAFARTAGWEPLLEAPLPDPYVLRDSGEWFVFGTGGHFFRGPSLARGAMQRVDLQFDFGTETGRVVQVWSFAPYRHTDGSLHAYGTLHYGDFRTVLGHFLPQDDSMRRWRLDKVLVGSIAQGRTTMYDPKMHRDEDGTLYLVYSASPARHTDVSILAQRMRDPANIDSAAQPLVLLAPQGYRSEDRNPGYIQLVEATNIIRVAGRYALFYSVGDFALPNYKLAVAYSDRLIGPYTKVLYPDPKNIWGSNRGEEVHYLLQSQHPDWPGYVGDWVVGPGVGSLIEENGAWTLVFHGYRPDDTVRNPDNRFVWRLPVRLHFSDEIPSWDWLRPVLPLRDERNRLAAASVHTNTDESEKRCPAAAYSGSAVRRGRTVAHPGVAVGHARVTGD